MDRSTRSQSEVVGVILLTAVVVILVTVIGTILFASFNANTQSEQRISLLVEVDNSTVTLKHNGGATFDSNDIEVIVRGDPEERTVLTAGNYIAGSETSIFEASDIWRYDHNQSPGTVRILVIDQQTGTLLYSRAVVVPG